MKKEIYDKSTHINKANQVKYGFIIDNRKCIGCHACTVACKSEHNVPIGVTRTFVKQVEKGEFPNSKRLFSVMRCNHCSDAPCMSICPTDALYKRKDGIIDFDNRRCIGCKSCMQACPYDALYIDPETHTSAKCNYCAHRVDVGLKPACVIICPEQAIISGNMKDPKSEISQLLSKHDVKVRKKEKNTQPNLFYINAEDVSLVPSKTSRSSRYIWNSQTTGVGHFAKFADSLTKDKSLTDLQNQLDPKLLSANEITDKQTNKESEKRLIDKVKRVFDFPDKGILWGREVSGYVWTKAISTGTFLVAFFSAFLPSFNEKYDVFLIGIITGLIFLAFTGVLLIKDLDQPKRFLYVLLRPRWESWLVKGGYAITFFGILLSVSCLMFYLELSTTLFKAAMCSAALLAVITSIYTAFLFRQAKGRDLWQSPILLFHMLTHSIMAGGSVFSLISCIPNCEFSDGFLDYINTILIYSLIINLLLLIIEFKLLKHTEDSKETLKMISIGRYKNSFWIGVITLGNTIPLCLAFSGNHHLLSTAGLLVIVGIYIAEHIWIEAPQRISLT